MIKEVDGVTRKKLKGWKGRGEKSDASGGAPNLF